MSLSDPVGWAVLGMGIAALFAYVGFVVLSVVQVVRSAAFEGLAKVLWVLAIVVFPVFGTMAWYLVGDRTSEAARWLGLSHSF